MRMLQVVSSMDPLHGGIAQGVRNTIPELDRLGCISDVLTMDDPNSPFLQDDKFTIYALGPAKGPWTYAPLLRKWLIENIECYDAIIVNGLWLYYGYAVNKVFEIMRRKGRSKLPKLLVMPHGMLDPYFQKAAGRKFKAVRNWFYWKFIEADLINNADAVLFTAEEEMRMARDTFHPYHPKQEHNIGYGIIEPPEFTSEMKVAFEDKLTYPLNKPFLLFLSRINPKKGVDLLLKAYIKLYNQNGGNVIFPDLVIVGPGQDTAYGKHLKDMLEKYPDAKSAITFVDMLRGDAKWGAFYTCEAFILPSHQENFGIAVAEALACSKSVLISNQINIWREIVDCNGGIVQPDTTRGTEDLIMEWVNLSTSEKKIMEKGARKAFEINFKINSTAKKLKNVLSELA